VNEIPNKVGGLFTFHQIQAITWAHPTTYLTDTGDKTDGT